jgi:ERCC4-related helicase/HKD family nuclease
MTDNRLPAFASNRPDLGKTVGAEINKLFMILRTKFAQAPSLAIATAYINPGGFRILADELEQAPRVRLLVGAEPEEDLVRGKLAQDKNIDKRIRDALKEYELWLAAERDSTGFTREAVGDSRRMVEWLRSLNGTQPRVEVRRFNHGFLHGKAFIVDDDTMPAVLAGSSNMTLAGLSFNAELNMGYPAGATGHVAEVKEWFEHYWEQSEPFDLAAYFDEQWKPHSPWQIFMRMLWELYGSHADEENPSGTLSLTSFQRDGVSRMERLLEQNGGVLVADEVGLGKSFLAGEVIKKATEQRRQRVAIVCPAAVKKSMWEPFLKEYDFSRRLIEVYTFEELRNKLDREKNPDWQTFEQLVAEFSLVVIDEAHNLRNAETARAGAADKLILSGKFPKQVILLTATPVNNKLDDLETLIKYFVRDDAKFANIGIPSIRKYIKRAQDMDPENLTPDHLFDLMDQVAVRRTRKFIKDNYSGDTIKGNDGIETTIKFPTPRSRRIEYQLDAAGELLVDRMLMALHVDDDQELDSYRNRKDDPTHLMLARYTPSAYSKTGDLESHQIRNAGLLRSALLKRLESSPAALTKTLTSLVAAHSSFLSGLDAGFVVTGKTLRDFTSSDDEDFESFIETFDLKDEDNVGDANDYKVDELREDVQSDLELLTELLEIAKAAHDNNDPKFDALLNELDAIASAAAKPDKSGIDEGDLRKVIIFSTFADTVVDIQDRLEAALSSPSGRPSDKYAGRLAPATMGAYASTQKRGARGGVDQGGRAQTIAGFAPKTAGERIDGRVISEDLFDIIVTTDVLAEGVNLQQASQIINYDLPWNPMRIVQRHGRVDRIGSQHLYVDLGLFFPGAHLDEMLRLEATLERKLAQAHAATGESIDVISKGRGDREVILADASMQKMDELLENRGANIALSGEEYRRRLFNHIERTHGGEAAKSMPYGSGSGFENPRVQISGYAFCFRIGKHEQPWFRFVETDANWQPILEDGNPKVSKEALVSLIAADPVNETTARVLTEEAYNGAFDAWAIAQHDAFTDWTALTDPAEFDSQPPKSFRDAYLFIKKHGDELSVDAQRDTLARLKSVPSSKVEDSMRGILRGDNLDTEKVNLIIKLLDDSGIQANPRREPLPPVAEHEIRLVTWMAIKGTNQSHIISKAR